MCKLITDKELRLQCKNSWEKKCHEESRHHRKHDFLSVEGKQKLQPKNDKFYDGKTIKRTKPLFTNKVVNRLKQDKHRNHCSQVILSLTQTTQNQFRRQ